MATITDASYPDAFGVTETPYIADDGSSVRLKVADTEDRIQSGATDIDFGTVTLSGRSAGEVRIDASVEEFDTESGDSVAPRVESATLPVAELAPIVEDRVPQDHDGDGHFENINANGRVDFDDVAELFQHQNEPPVTEHATAYDYNDDDTVNLQDVMVLFRAV
ncbi:MAG: dockerin type I domain-containing protein [Halococcoides sp.]